MYLLTIYAKSSYYYILYDNNMEILHNIIDKCKNKDENNITQLIRF